MNRIERTTSDNIDFKNLVVLLDEYLKITDGDEHDFYHQFNGIVKLKNVVVLYHQNEIAGCGAFKKYDDYSVEVKRMFVHPKFRNNGFATVILNELEKWAAELNFVNTILETGKKQPEAIALYQKLGYTPILNYGQYVGVENSVCMKKNN